jgi:hypothetical protein
MFALEASGVLNSPAHYLSWGWVSISVPNLVVIVLMLVIFGLALVLPFPKDRSGGDDGGAE